MLNSQAQRPNCWYHDLGFEQSGLVNGNQKKKDRYIQTARCVHRQSTPYDANIIFSQVAYEFNVEVDKSL